MCRTEDVQFAVNQHGQHITRAEIGVADIIFDIGNGQVLPLRFFSRKGDGGRRVVDAGAGVPEFGQAASIEARTTAQVKD